MKKAFNYVIVDKISVDNNILEIEIDTYYKSAR